MNITAKNVQEFEKFESIVKGLGYKEDARINVFFHVTSIVIETQTSGSQSVYVPKKLEVKNISFKVEKDEYDREICVIETLGTFDGNSVTIKERVYEPDKMKLVWLNY